MNHIVAVDPKLAAKEIRELAKWAEHLRQALCGEPLELPKGFERGEYINDLAGRVRSRMAWHYRRVWAFLNNGEPDFLPYNSELADLFSAAWRLIECNIEERDANDHYEFMSEGATRPVYGKLKPHPANAPGAMRWAPVREVVTPSKRFVNGESVKSFVTRLLAIVDQIEAAILPPTSQKHPSHGKQKPTIKPPLPNWSGASADWPEIADLDFSEYRYPKDFFRDVWVYVQRNSSASNASVRTTLNSKMAKSHQWAIIESDNTLRDRSKKIADFMGWKKSDKKRGPKAGTRFL